MVKTILSDFVINQTFHGAEHDAYHEKDSTHHSFGTSSLLPCLIIQVVVVAAIIYVCAINTRITKVQIYTFLSHDVHQILLSTNELDHWKMRDKLIARVVDLNLKWQLDGYLREVVLDALVTFQMMGKLTFLKEEDLTQRLCIDQNLLVSVAFYPNIILCIHMFLNHSIKPRNFDD